LGAGNAVAFDFRFGYTKPVVNIRCSWNKISRAYVRDYEISSADVHYGPLCPGDKTLQLLGDLTGKTVLEMGCGAGQNALALSRRGAVVSGIDFSETQISQAEELALSAGANISFHAADICALPMFANASFDLVFSSCAIAFVKDFELAFTEAFRLAKNGALFVLSDMHPLQYILDETNNGVQFNHPYPFNPIRLDWSWEFKDGGSGEVKAGFRHYVRSLSTYHNALFETGFIVEKILEPKSTLKTPHLGFSREIWKEYKYIAQHLPITYIIVSRKP
jgi:ubiquinone/menaquinone biosynthesis C-methylase UbiE